MFGFKRPTPPEAQGQETPREEQRPTITLPDELRDALEAALGNPVPRELTKEQMNALTQEVSRKAPSLQRRLVELILEEYRQKVRNKPAPRTARPAPPLGWFYVQDQDGNWVPSRFLYTAAMMLAAVLLMLVVYFSFGSPRRPPPSQAAEPASTVQATPTPPREDRPSALPQEASPGGEGLPSAPGAPQAGATSPMPQAPPSPLPPPPADLPPPPDYEGTQGPAQGGPTGEGPTVVLYSRKDPLSPEGAQTGLALSAAGRDLGPLTVVGAKPPFQDGTAEAPSPSPGPSGSFWTRKDGGSGSAQEEAGDILAFRREDPREEATGAKEGYWLRKGQGEAKEEETALLRPPQEGKPAPGEEGPTQIWVREAKPEGGGIIPPSGASSPRPSSAPEAPTSPGAGTP